MEKSPQPCQSSPNHRAGTTQPRDAGSRNFVAERREIKKPCLAVVGRATVGAWPRKGGRTATVARAHDHRSAANENKAWRDKSDRIRDKEMPQGNWENHLRARLNRDLSHRPPCPFFAVFPHFAKKEAAARQMNLKNFVFSFSFALALHYLWIRQAAARQMNLKNFVFSFSFALALHYLWIRQAAARQMKLKNFVFSFSFALALHYLCAMLWKKTLTPVLFLMLLLMPGCYYSYPNKNDHWTAANPEAVDSVNFYISHHYWTGYNFKAVDSLELLTAPPLAGLPDYGAMPDDTLVVRRHDELVVARVMYVPSDSVDSVWVKVARDQLTQGWIRERTLLAGVTPNDPISKFIYHFSGTRTVWAFSLLGISLAFWLVRRMRHKPERMVHFHDIPSFYPTLLCLCVSCSAVLYGSIQKFAPSTWVEFYYHPTINPFNTQLPAILALFIASAWAILVVAVAVCDEVRRQNDMGGEISYLASLSAVCVALYLVFTLTTPFYIGYVLLIVYFVFAIWQYWRHKPSHLVCGMCGHAIRSRGACPHCGTINE